MQENQSSITAENNAAVRASEAMRPPHEQICNDTYAHLFLSDRFADSHNMSDCLSRTMANWEIAVPGVCGSVIARTRFIDDCLANAIENRIEQLVILGAGYDTRALRFGALKEKVKVFEIDHPATQQFKLRQLKKYLWDLKQYVTYIPVNFEEKDFGQELLAHGYDRTMKTFFIWEGVTYYLSAEVVDGTLSFISKNCASGSEIVFDYFSASMAAGTCKLPEALPLSRILNTFGENILFGISPENMAGFLEKHGFKIIQSLAAENYEKAYFKGKSGKGRTVSKLFYFILAMVI